MQFGGIEHSVKRLLLRFGNFCAYDNNDDSDDNYNDNRTDYFTPCACVRGKYDLHVYLSLVGLHENHQISWIRHKSEL